MPTHGRLDLSLDNEIGDFEQTPSAANSAQNMSPYALSLFAAARAKVEERSAARGSAPVREAAPAPVAAPGLSPIGAAAQTPAALSAMEAAKASVIRRAWKPTFKEMKGNHDPNNYYSFEQRDKAREKMSKYELNRIQSYTSPREYMDHLDAPKPSWYDIKGRRSRTWEKRARDMGLMKNQVREDEKFADAPTVPDEYHTGKFAEERGIAKQTGFRASLSKLKNKAKAKMGY